MYIDYISPEAQLPEEKIRQKSGSVGNSYTSSISVVALPAGTMG
jgi:hypothetical protein